MWTHLERQAGGKVKGMGEKQIEVDKRILRTQVSSIQSLKLYMLIIDPVKMLILFTVVWIDWGTQEAAWIG